MNAAEQRRRQAWLALIASARRAAGGDLAPELAGDLRHALRAPPAFPSQVASAALAAEAFRQLAIAFLTASTSPRIDALRSALIEAAGALDLLLAIEAEEAAERDRRIMGEAAA